MALFDNNIPTFTTIRIIFILLLIKLHIYLFLNPDKHINLDKLIILNKISEIEI